MIGLIIESDKIAIGTVCSLLVAFSAAIFRVYGKAQEERKLTAEQRVGQMREELERHREDDRADREQWEEERRELNRVIDRLSNDLLECWKDKYNNPRQGDSL